MNTRQDIDGFLGEKTIAVVGISRDDKSFSAAAFRKLKAEGYRLFPVNPNAQSIDGARCYPDVASLPEKPGAAIFFTRPDITVKALTEAVGAGIRRVWIQQGAENDAVLGYCREKTLQAVTGQCIMMFAEPVKSIHAFHRFVWNLFGKIPK